MGPLNKLTEKLKWILSLKMCFCQIIKGRRGKDATQQEEKGKNWNIYFNDSQKHAKKKE